MVDYKTLYLFLKKYYKYEYFEGRNDKFWGLNYSENITKTKLEELKLNNISLISKRESKLDKTIVFNSNLNIIKNRKPKIVYKSNDSLNLLDSSNNILRVNSIVRVEVYKNIKIYGKFKYYKLVIHGSIPILKFLTSDKGELESENIFLSNFYYNKVILNTENTLNLKPIYYIEKLNPKLVYKYLKRGYYLKKEEEWYLCKLDFKLKLDKNIVHTIKQNLKLKGSLIKL